MATIYAICSICPGIGPMVGSGRTDCDGCGCAELPGTLIDSSTYSLTGVGASATACRVLGRPRCGIAKCVLVHYLYTQQNQNFKFIH